jgi:hypothetical protein
MVTRIPQPPLAHAIGLAIWPAWVCAPSRRGRAPAPTGASRKPAQTPIRPKTAMHRIRHLTVPTLIVATSAALGGLGAWFLPIGARQPAPQLAAATLAARPAVLANVATPALPPPPVPPAPPNPEPLKTLPVEVPTTAEQVEAVAVASDPPPGHPAADEPAKTAIAEQSGPARRAHAARPRVAHLRKPGTPGLPRPRAGTLSPSEF